MAIKTILLVVRHNKRRYWFLVHACTLVDDFSDISNFAGIYRNFIWAISIFLGFQKKDVAQHETRFFTSKRKKTKNRKTSIVFL